MKGKQKTIRIGSKQYGLKYQKRLYGTDGPKRYQVEGLIDFYKREITIRDQDSIENTISLIHEIGHGILYEMYPEEFLHNIDTDRLFLDRFAEILAYALMDSKMLIIKK
jgi:hypothetical protein